MLEVKNLTKIFKSKKNENCIALDNISFTLPDTGFIFITGKSGSGKSTLLSLIGALDNISSGHILLNGVSIENLSNLELSNYRNHHVGFIFQDYHLLDELTISENINLSLKLQNTKNNNKVKDVLKKVDLENYDNRYPKELSGGQKQRIAIARALVKDPSIILADEPTGNLDEKTTIQILDLLKKISQTKLVIIVSHDMINVLKYADRIIELNEGIIISDKIRNNDNFNNVEIKNETLFLQINHKLTEQDINEIDKSLNDSQIKHIQQIDNKFIDNNENLNINNNVKLNLNSNHINFKDKIKLGFSFLKKHITMLLLYSIIITIVIQVMSLTELISSFDSNKVISNELNNNDISSLVLRKSHVTIDGNTWESSQIVPIEEKEINELKRIGYNGNIYKLSSIALPINDGTLTDYHRRFYYYPIKNIYPITTQGTLICDEQYLINKYGQNNEINYILKSNEIKPYGVYITDFIADGILTRLSSSYKTYNDIIGNYHAHVNTTQGYINGIIQTNYKERYKDVIQSLENFDDIQSSDEMYKNTINFIDEVYQYLSICYSFNPNFNEDWSNSCIKKAQLRTITMLEYNNQKKEINEILQYNLDEEKFNLNKGEIILPLKIVNSITNLNYTNINDSTFKPFNINYYHYPADEKMTNFLNIEKYNVVGMTDEMSIYFNKEDYRIWNKNNNYYHSLYLDDLSLTDKLIAYADNSGFTPVSSFIKPLKQTTNIILMLKPLFIMLFILLGIVVLFLLINYSSKNIENHIHEIGVIKSLGARNKDILIIFSLHTLILTLIVTLLYIGFSPLFIKASNNLLITSILNFSTDVVLDNSINLLLTSPLFILINTLIIILISILAYTIPTIKLNKIKPINIMKAKE